jgi:hypothetical protein
VHFLHAVAWNTRDGTQVGTFIFHYADGAEISKPIIYGQDVRDWWHYPATPLETTEAAIAWRGTNSAIKELRVNIPPGSEVPVYDSEWQNPRPETEIVHLDYVSAMADQIAPFLIALTAQ